MAINPQAWTVGDLRKYLETLPATMPLAYQLHSAFAPMHKDLLAIQTLPLFDNGGYLSKVFDVKDEPLTRQYLVFPGN